jgi:hypothetical protein
VRAEDDVWSKRASAGSAARGRAVLARRARVFAVLAVACTWSSETLGADEATANALLREGAELFKHEDYEGARGAFARAYALEPRPATLFNLALSELNAGHPVEAAAHLREYVTYTDEPPAKLASVRTKWLPRAEARTARLNVFAPAGAQLFVDGVAQEPATAAPDAPNGPTAAIAIAAGEHDVSARQGTVSETQHVTAAGGALVELHFQRVPDAPAQAPATERTARADAPASVRVKTSHPEHVAVVVLGAGALAAAGLGLAFDVAAQSQAGDVQGTRNTLAAGSTWTNRECTGANAATRLCSQLKSEVDDNRQDWTVAAIAYVGAGVLGVASLVTWIGWKPKPGAFTARPTLDARGAGFVFDGKW